MKISIVTSLYKSEPYVNEFYNRIKAVIEKLKVDYEIIFVDDGSPDNSLEKAIQIQQLDKKVMIIELSRNFGHHKAIVTGLKHSKGDYVFLIDIDLEEDPELLLPFWEEMQSSKKIDVIYGVQKKRKGGFIERWGGIIYFKLLNKISDEVKTTENISIVRLMKKKYVDALVQYKEHNYYFGPISSLVGFNQKAFFFDKKSRKTTSYNLLKRYHIFLDSLISFSSAPLYFILYFGGCIALASFSYMTYLIVRELLFGIAVHGWTSLIVLISLFGGLIIFFMGIMSVYILHIAQETKNKPFTVIRNIYHDQIALGTEGKDNADDQ